MRNPHQRAGRDVYLHHYVESRIFMIRGQVLSNCLFYFPMQNFSFSKNNSVETFQNADFQ